MPRPANDVKRLGAILLVGAVAGLGASYVASRKRPAHWTDGGLIDWDTVRQIAVQFSQHTQAPVHNRAAAREQYTSMVRRAEPLIAAYLQVNLPEPIQRIVVMDRKEWLSANIDNFTHLFRFVEELYARNARPRTIGASLAAGVNRRLMSVQIGLLLGVIARRVLGQYDLSLLAPEPTGGALYFVEPNIERIQRMLGLDAHDFRMWIALHEATHAYEFEAYPWVREHFNGLLRRYFDTVNEQLQGFKGGIGPALARILEGRRQGRHWMESLQTPTQRAIFRDLQAIMSLVEGYSNHIMNAIGRQVLPNFDEIERRIEAYKSRSNLAEQLFNRITGMDLKLLQYQQGQHFVDSVVQQRGIAFANRVWERAEHLPTLDEIRDPARWIARMERA
ncbi:zinc-dependent metalloprotease [Kallotenue papyrolyticum]|uniref:zinc-dependent metalloprotease n=1 Tax=Kallotenue papyrolyticum TaxID=1325125 RepID=UPI0004786678|nr:zinc-dependent metalloprotease [Kallotenue papyrolyticum]